MIVLGIDPGVSGGAAMLSNDPNPTAVLGAARMPTYVEGKKTLVDADNLFRWWMAWPIDVAVIEWVHAMPKQGVTSSFSFGRSTGSVEAVAQLCAKRVVWVSPQRWKKHFGLGSDKYASLDLVQEKFPGWQWTKRVEDGLAEAALMALWYLDTEDN